MVEYIILVIVRYLKCFHFCKLINKGLVINFKIVKQFARVRIKCKIQIDR